MKRCRCILKLGFILWRFPRSGNKIDSGDFRQCSTTKFGKPNLYRPPAQRSACSYEFQHYAHFRKHASERRIFLAFDGNIRLVIQFIFRIDLDFAANGSSGDRLRDGWARRPVLSRQT